MDPRLVALKKNYTNHLAYGDIFGLVKDNVLQFAWRDAQVVLFMTTVHDGKDTVVRARKCPRNVPAYIKNVWDGAPIKDLEVPVAIDEYNHHMNAVDLADQMRGSYDRETRQFRTWKPLFRFLLGTSLVNATKLWIKGRPASKKKNQSFEFRNEVALRLLAGTKAAPKGLRGVQRDASTTAPIAAISGSNTGQITCSGPSSMGWKDSQICTSCQSSGRRILKRKFGDLSGSKLNSRQGSQSSQGSQGSQKSRLKRTRYGCKTCMVAVCNDSICWQDHIATRTPKSKQQL
jgi:hypothetical protein